MTFDRFDVVIVPFPFTDLPVIRRRPALVLSAAAWNTASGHVVCAMITSAGRSRWPLDVPIADLAAAGLNAPCVVRMKLFTIEAGLVVRKAGMLESDDRLSVQSALNECWANSQLHRDPRIRLGATPPAARTRPVTTETTAGRSEA